MRVHRLRITAFGPFAGTVEVDLDALAANGLFLLHGPTGAGKTSVLDAVCFALYGAVPGSRHGARLRSDHAAEGVPPEVVCEFTAGGRRLEVTRSPAWERPKRRGTGTTTEQARVLVRELGDGDWQPLTNRVDEAGLVLDGVLGLGLEQFTKLVLLPQGEFAAFLRADAETRRALLERLFGTDRFAAVQQWLRESQSGLRALVEAADVVTGQLRARAEQAALPAGVHVSEGNGDGAGSHPGGDHEPDGERDAGTSAGGITAPEPGVVVDRLRAAVAAALEEARARRVAAQERARHAAAEHDAARRTAELQGRHRELTGAATRLRSHEHEHERRRERLSAARRASGLSRWLAPLAAARARSQVALDRVDAAVVELVECGPLRRAPVAPTVGDVQLCLAGLGDLSIDDGRLDDGRLDDAHLDDAGLDDAELEAEVRSAQQLVGELAALEQEAASEAALAASVEAAWEARDGARRDVEAAAAAAAAAREDTAAAARELTAARAAAAREPAARQVLELAGARLAAAVDAAARAAEAAGLSSRREVLRRQRDDARERWLDLREQRLVGVAAELAAALADGDPCPVCGSPDHPVLATPAGRDAEPQAAPALAAAAAEEQAGADAEAADDLLRRCESELARARAQAEAAVAAAGGRSVDTARAEHDAAAADLDAAGHAAAAVAAALARQERAELALETAAGRHDRAAERLKDTATELTRLEERLLALHRRLDAGRGAYDTVEARRAHASRRALAGTGLLDARRELRGATEHLADVTGTARAAATDAGFTDLGSACEAALPGTELAALEEACAAHAHEQAMVEKGLADPALAAASAEAPVDPRVAETAWQLAQADDEAAAAALDRCDTAHRALTVIAAQLAAHLAETEPVRVRYRVESGLSRCLDGTGGDNVLRMSLSSYVLAARLEQVAAAASERLLVISGGRYSLEHSDGAERGRGRSGLALRVVDAWTGRSRDTASLSGGESFYTSLALALGLADVVAAEAGGALIETLFVDEGFGSLDDDTLSEVMDVLDGLRSGGRVVGLVSHVGDLRDRIPARLEVVKTRAGSTLLQAIA